MFSMVADFDFVDTMGKLCDFCDTSSRNSTHPIFTLTTEMKVGNMGIECLVGPRREISLVE